MNTFKKKCNQLLTTLRWEIPIPYKHYLGRKNPKKLVERGYRRQFKREMDFENPKNFNEIICMLKIKGNIELWSKLADKYLVREHIKERGFENNLVKLYGVWDNAKDIDFDALPDKFILKTNNAAGTVVIVKDKSTLDIPATRKLLNRMLRKVYGISSAQLHYRLIEPKIIAEELLENDPEISAISSSLIDYKWFCFNGYVSYVEAMTNRGSKSGKRSAVFSPEWVEHPEFMNVSNRLTNTPIPKPKQLKEMVEMCQTLSKGHPFVRVDLYEINGKVYFGELTFTPGGGLSKTRSDLFLDHLADIYYQNIPESNL